MGTCTTHKDCNEVVILECVLCPARKQVTAPHSMSDAALVRKYFKGWTAKGAFGAQSTKCPKHH